MFDGAFADGIHVCKGIEKNDQVWHDLGAFDGLESIHLNFVGESAREPPVTDVVSQRSDALCGFVDYGPQVRSRADKNDLSAGVGD